ncbi:MAG: TylF/MycF/NovP-related O-methyltransferase, partial [Armatimonadota bacterium]
MSSFKQTAKRYLPKPLLSAIRSVRRRIAGPDPNTRLQYEDYCDFFRKAFITLNSNGIVGDYAEFGCWGANTFCIAHRMLAGCPYQSGPWHMWAFDSFEGLPTHSLAEDEHVSWTPGAMATPLDEFHKLCRSRGVPRDAYT